MRVLALDAATESCSVALLTGSDIIERLSVGMGQAQRILDMIDAVLSEGQVSLSMLDGLAVSIGPGSFTGVRISVSVAQGLAYGAGLAVAPVTTLEALAWQAINGGAQCALACLDARMGEVYWACYAADPVRGVLPAIAPQVGHPDSVHLNGAAARGIGRGFAVYPRLGALPGLELVEHDSLALPRARDMAMLGALTLGRGEGLDPADLSPLYLRDKVALTEAERRQGPG